MTPEQFFKNKQELEAATRALDRAEGALQELLARLKKDFGLKDLAAAKKELLKVEKEGKDLDTEFDTKSEKVRKEYPHLFK